MVPSIDAFTPLPAVAVPPVGTSSGGHLPVHEAEVHVAFLPGLAPGEWAGAVASIRRFQRRVYGLAMTILSDSAAAEDVAQETFARAWRHAGAYDPRRARVATWLLTIARNLAIDSLRMR